MSFDALVCVTAKANATNAICFAWLGCLRFKVFIRGVSWKTLVSRPAAKASRSAVTQSPVQILQNVREACAGKPVNVHYQDTIERRTSVVTSLAISQWPVLRWKCPSTPWRDTHLEGQNTLCEVLSCPPIIPTATLDVR